MFLLVSTFIWKEAITSCQKYDRFIEGPLTFRLIDNSLWEMHQENILSLCKGLLYRGGCFKVRQDEEIPLHFYCVGKGKQEMIYS